MTVTERPWLFKMRPIEATQIPLPMELTTPPVTKMYLVGIRIAAHPTPPGVQDHFAGPVEQSRSPYRNLAVLPDWELCRPSSRIGRRLAKVGPHRDINNGQEMIPLANLSYTASWRASSAPAGTKSSVRKIDSGFDVPWRSRTGRCRQGDPAVWGDWRHRRH